MQRNLAAKAKKNVVKLQATNSALAANSGSGGSFTALSVWKPSPQATSSSFKRSRPDGDLVDLTMERPKSKFFCILCFISQGSLREIP